ncbi:hypothetical protein BC938DRAFT_483656 [Jimgerdemannia flammicorona]|uniref:Uncharacterized protein n=1 Tax=Jimgerdemannia flammicorona TaxID=994334 RepID=A0A433QBI8_9FUNG|nr:hypothetical protein BC938DRAFT_483656 [Jimgerdemannia flammicorona]
MLEGVAKHLPSFGEADFAVSFPDARNFDGNYAGVLRLKRKADACALEITSTSVDHEMRNILDLYPKKSNIAYEDEPCLLQNCPPPHPNLKWTITNTQFHPNKILHSFAADFATFTPPHCRHSPGGRSFCGKPRTANIVLISHSFAEAQTTLPVNA